MLIVICDRMKIDTSLFNIDTTLINMSETRGVITMFINPRNTNTPDIDPQSDIKPIIVTINPNTVPHLKINEANLYSIPYHLIQLMTIAI